MSPSGSTLAALLVCLFPALAAAQRPVALVDPSLPVGGWSFSNGQEFPGATGSLTLDAAVQDHGHATLKLAGDFTKGGAYVNLGRRIDRIDIRRITFRVKYPGHTQLGLQLNDGSGQTHQMRLALQPSDDWQDVVLPLEDFFASRGTAGAVTGVSRYETWGGAKDGKWHGPASGVYLALGPEEKQKTPVMWVSEVTIQPPCDTVAESFETPLSSDWKSTGDAARDSSAGHKSASSLRLARTLDAVEKPCAITGPEFVVAPGKWDLSTAVRSQLESPDNSYRAITELIVQDATGREIQRHTVAEAFGKQDWRLARVSATLPRDAARGHFEIRMEKAHGTFWIDDLTAVRTAPPSAAEAVATRLLFSTARLGNLLLPGDPRDVRVEVLARRALAPQERKLTWSVRDYWGQLVTAPATIDLGEAAASGKEWRHEARLDLSTAPLETGRYYEIHAAVNGPATGEPLRHTTSLAILPEAPARKYQPLEIPFTSRNWDNRLTEYIRLSDRLGVRICGLWGGWSMKPPYSPELPGLEETKRLGLGWLTNTPAAQIERGDTPLDETALREGARQFIEKYGSNKPFIVNLGNEPHGTGDKVLRNVAAYKAVYQAVKAADPSVTVVATSVEPNEEYFKAGYGQWCDAFDFHIYETAADVRRTMREYRALMKKYGVEKPLWSTELGLNSQGMSRQAVASEVWKKTAAFFAEGGASMSWFGFLYPDKDGTSFGSSGDSHNMFDCRFNHYAPRLDAVAWYNAVNGLTVKKFAAERTWPSGVQATLFRDAAGASLLFLWREKGALDITLPLPGAGPATLIHLDGRRSALDTAGRDLTLSVDADPLLVLFNSPTATLPDTLPPAPTAFATPLPEHVPAGKSVAAHFTGDITPQPAPFWTPSQTSPRHWTWQPAPGESPREVEIIARLPGNRGELYRRVRIFAP